MSVVEQSTCGKCSDPAQDEDALFVGEHFIGIIDGATAKSDVLWDGMRSSWPNAPIDQPRLNGRSLDPGASWRWICYPSPSDQLSMKGCSTL